jgi:uridine kinase
MGLVDWDDPASWLRDDAIDAIERLCRDGEADVPVYDIAHDGRGGHRALSLGDSRYFVAEGIFAQEVVAACAARGLLADAICVRNHRLVTFWRRLSRDLRERRKPPAVLLRRGLLLMKKEPGIVAHAVSLGCATLTPDEAFERVRRLLDGVEPGYVDPASEPGAVARALVELTTQPGGAPRILYLWWVWIG